MMVLPFKKQPETSMFQPSTPYKAMVFTRVTDETREALESVAREHNTTLSEVVRVLIMDGLKRLEDDPQSADAA
jgi:hypothetical protein